MIHIKAFKDFFKLCAKLTLFVPIFVFMVYASYRIDPSGLFFGAGFERVASEYMLNGAYLKGYERLDGRKLNETYAKNVEYAPQVIINGSSRSMTISKEIAPNKTFYNAANTGGDRYDFFTSYYIFAKEGNEPETIILSIDPWLFNSSVEAIDKRSNRALYAEFMSKELGFSDYTYPQTNPYEKYEALVSPSYFQSAIRYYLRDTSQEISPEPIYDNVHNQDSVLKSPDGSIIYDVAFLNRSQADIDSDLFATVNPTVPLLRMFDFFELDPVFIQQFEAYIEYLQAKNINVIFYLPPYHEHFYNTADSQRDLYQSFFDAEDYCIRTAKKYNIPLYGSYNPKKLNLDYWDFLDAFHMNPKSISKVLPSIE